MAAWAVHEALWRAFDSPLTDAWAQILLLAALAPVAASLLAPLPPARLPRRGDVAAAGS